MADNEIILDFCKADYSDATVYDEHSLIHRSCMKQIESIWGRLYEIAQGENEQKDFHRYHNAISIFASRGAGKTTFLLSFLDRIKKEKGNKILCLDPIDPSLIENKQHPFINIIAGIQEKVHKAMSEDFYNSGGRKFEYKKEQKECYNELLKALPFLDGIGPERAYTEWDDEEYISIQGMNRAKASNNLERAFHEYVKQTLKLLEKECLVISFDDIDTDFKKGFEILEVIRKYLTSGQVIVILTGDLELYGKLVRKAQWKGFDKDFLEKEIRYAKHQAVDFADMIDQLENQYLIKILKPENRILLKTLREYINDENYKIFVKLKDEEKIKDISICYDQVIAAVGIHKDYGGNHDKILRFLLDLSLRGQIRILTLLNETQTSARKLADGLLNVFWNDINQKASNAKALLNSMPIYTIEMLKFLVYNRSLFIGSNFMPETGNRILNKALFAVGIKYNELVKQNKFLIFDYWLRVSYVKALAEKLGGKSNPKVVDELLDFSQITAEAGLTKSIGLSHAFCHNRLNNRPDEIVDTMSGTIYLKERPQIYGKRFENALVWLPILGTVNGQKQESVFISIYKLLELIREYLFLLENNKTRRDLSIPVVNRLIQYRTYMEPINQGQPINIFQKEYKEEYINWLNEKHNIKLRQIFENLQEWAEREVDVSVQLLDRIFTRFYYSVISIDENPKRYWNAGIKFSSYIISLFNSALLEEYVEQGNYSKWYFERFVNLNHTDDIEIVFLCNYMSIVHGQRKIGSVCKWLMECPLLRVFVDPLFYHMLESREGMSDASMIDIIRYKRDKERISLMEEELDDLGKQLACSNKVLEWINYNFDIEEIQAQLDSLSAILNRYRNESKKEDVLRSIISINNTMADLNSRKEKIRNNMPSLNSKEREIVNNGFFDKSVMGKISLDLKKQIAEKDTMLLRVKENLNSLKSQWKSKRNDLDVKLANLDTDINSDFHILSKILI